MKEKTKDTIELTIFLSIIFFVVCVGAWGFFDMIYGDNQRNDYCENLFPSPLEKDTLGRELVWGEAADVEEGYVRCCRRYSENHEIKEECEIFEMVSKG